VLLIQENNHIQLYENQTIRARERIKKETGKPVITSQNAASLNSLVTGMIEEITGSNN
jgi:predicted transcriptional regulator